jgi:hypothetical protein
MGRGEGVLCCNELLWVQTAFIKVEAFDLKIVVYGNFTKGKCYVDQGCCLLELTDYGLVTE